MNHPAHNAVSLPRYRACDLCLNRETATSGHCRAEAVRVITGARLVPIETARAPKGPCGPDAWHLDMAAWQS